MASKRTLLTDEEVFARGLATKVVLVVAPPFVPPLGGGEVESSR